MISTLLKWSVGLSVVAAKAMTGANAGGWMVLEPWITPSLFYRFLGKAQNETAMDSFTLCETLGATEGNAVMRAHWDAWYNESSIADLAARGVEVVRLPVGDWTLDPYGPYVGCMDGAAEKIDWFYDTCAKYNIKILMDVHAMKDSQNGYDNSGKTSNVVWSEDGMNFTHWADQASNWYGDWNVETRVYDHINYASVNWGLKVHEHLLQRWGSHSAFYAFEPINEPQYQPIIEVLHDFYRESRKLVQRYTANAWFVMHNAQVLDPEVWNSLFRDDDMDQVAVDIHYYQAFLTGARFATVQDACDDYETVISQQVDRLKYPVWLGEWALATDVCAWWLGGFNTANTHP
jgi:glucan 1,3-beta-glucosidase